MILAWSGIVSHMLLYGCLLLSLIFVLPRALTRVYIYIFILFIFLVRTREYGCKCTQVCMNACVGTCNVPVCVGTCVCMHVCSCVCV